MTLWRKMMTKHESYSGIDYFRMAAALLIVAIHTSPLASFSATGDFIVTRIIARVAVPFFFVTSGFFLISRYSYNADKLKTFIKRTACIYGIAIVLYIPINIYNGYFRMENLLPNLIKDIIFDGTLYHLWYLPASIMGAAIAWYLVKRVSYRKAFVITTVLYLVGLFGDSYYGIAQNILCLHNFYRMLFQVTDYTRNGIFFAPIFFVLGGYIANNEDKFSCKESIAGLVVCFALMFGEALTLHHFGLQRHDSMYVFLVPSICFLCYLLMRFKGKRKVQLRTISLLTYIMHPLVIVGIRLFAKVIHLQNLLVENSLMFYLLVCIVSVGLGVVLTTVWDKYKPRKPKHNVDTDRAYLEINLKNLEHNVKILQRAMSPRCKLMAVVKAESYGHGMYGITTYLNQIGVSAFAVATIDEGIRLRKYGVSGEILILGYTSPLRAKELYKYELTQTLLDYQYSLLLNKQGYEIKAHIKIDTGMHRLGFATVNIKEITAAFSMEHIKITGIFTHLCAADSREERDIEFTHAQIISFYNLLDELKNRAVQIPNVHIQSSYGLLNYPELTCDYVRVGIAMYGVLTSLNDETKLKPDLRPVLALKARVVLLRKIRKGETVGYNRTFTANRDSMIAILPIGYADGFPRNLSCGKHYVLICGQKAPIIGRICMDQLVVDVTDVQKVKIGDTATLIGKDGDEEITAPMVAENSESITNELLSRMGQRLRIVYKN